MEGSDQRDNENCYETAQTHKRHPEKYICYAPIGIVKEKCQKARTGRINIFKVLILSRRDIYIIIGVS
jgi:hypothetical protein